MLDKVDEMIIGGGMAFTFLKVLNNMQVRKTSGLKFFIWSFKPCGRFYNYNKQKDIFNV